MKEEKKNENNTSETYFNLVNKDQYSTTEANSIPSCKVYRNFQTAERFDLSPTQL